MKNHITKIIFILIGILFLIACEKNDRTQQQIDRDEIMAIERTLRDNRWGFEDLIVTVQYPTKAIPLLANVADENGNVLNQRSSGFDYRISSIVYILKSHQNRTPAV